jgi:hypothetical protein
MREIASIVSATLAGSFLLQSYFAIWHPSSYGRFAEFPAVLLFAVAISTIAFLVLVLPSFAWLRRTQRSLSVLAGFLVGLFFGFLAMLLFFALSRWPMHPSFFIAGGIAGAVGVSTYARLVYKRVG